MNRILIPLDGSELAEKVLDGLAAILSPTETRIVLLKVLEADEIEGTADRVIHTNKAKAYLGGVSVPLQKMGFAVETEWRTGEPADRILHFAETDVVDLIAISSHGASGRDDRPDMGSVAKAVFAGSTCPVLVYRPIGFVDREIDL